MKIDMNKLFDAKKIEIKDDVSNIDEVLEYEQILLIVSKNIIRYRKENNFTQAELAEKLKVNQTMISKLERGNYNPTLKSLHHISRVLSNSSDFLIVMLKDIITNLYKNKNIEYTMHLKEYETYRYNSKNNNVVYLMNSYNNKIDYGGKVYGRIYNTSKISVNG